MGRGASAPARAPADGELDGGVRRVARGPRWLAVAARCAADLHLPDSPVSPPRAGRQLLPDLRTSDGLTDRRVGTHSKYLSFSRRLLSAHRRLGKHAVRLGAGRHQLGGGGAAAGRRAPVPGRQGVRLRPPGIAARAGCAPSKPLLWCQSSCSHLRQGLLAGALVRAATIKSAAWHCGRNATCRAGSLATTVTLLEQVCARAWAWHLPPPTHFLIQN